MEAIRVFDRSRLDYEYQEDYGVETFLEHQFAGEDHKLRAEYTFSGHPEKEDNRYATRYTSPASPTEFDNTSIQPLENKNQVSLDYNNKLNNNSRFEAGYAGEINHSDYNFLVDSFDPLQNIFVTDPGKTNRFIFDETIHALYATYQQTFGEFGLLAGLRAEQSYTTSDLVTTQSVYKNNYLKLYPTMHLSYHISDAFELQPARSPPRE
jgi:hypothetical protein